MTAISPSTRTIIRAYLGTFVEWLIKEWSVSPCPTPNLLGPLTQTSSKGQLNPFHAAIIPPTLLRVSEFERGFSTALGTSYEECAKLIALEHHAAASRAYDVTGEVSVKALSEIER